MKLIVQQRSEVTIYEQLYSQIANQILNGNLTADECLPSIRVVARELQISVIPVKTAYEMLENDGYIYTIPGKGCFVKNIGKKLYNIKEKIIRDKITKLLDQAKALNMTPEELLEIFKEYIK